MFDSIKNKAIEGKTHIKDFFDAFAHYNDPLSTRVSKQALQVLENDVYLLRTLKSAATGGLTDDYAKTTKTYKELSDNAKKYFSEIVHGSKTIEDFSAAERENIVATHSLSAGAKAASVGLRLLGSAASMAISMLVSYAIQKAVEQIKELHVSMEDAANAAKDAFANVSDIDQVFKKYNEIASSTENYSEKQRQLAEWKSDLISKYYDERDAIDAVTLSLNGQAEAYTRLQQKEIDKGIEGMGDKYEKARKDIEEARPVIAQGATNIDFKKETNDFLKTYDLIARFIKTNDGQYVYSFTIDGNASEQLEKMRAMIREIRDIEQKGELPNSLEKLKTDIELRLSSLSKKIDDETLTTYTEGNNLFARNWLITPEAQKWIYNLRNAKAEYSSFVETVNNLGYGSGVKNSILDQMAILYPDIISEAKDAEGATEAYKRTLIETTESIGAAKEKIDSIKSAFTQFNEKQKASADSILALKEAFGEIDGATDLIEQFANASGVDEAEQALSRLADLYIHSTGVLDDFDEKNKQTAISQLELIGVTNAEAVVTEKIVKQKIDAITKTRDLTSEEELQYAAMLVAAGAASSEAEALNNIAVYKALASVPDFKNATYDEIAAIKSKCSALIGEAEITQDLIRLEQLRAKLNTGNYREHARENLQAEYDALAEKINQARAKLSNASNINLSELYQNIRKQMKGTGDDVDEFYNEYQKKLSDLKHSLAMGEITEEEYYRNLADLTETYLSKSGDYIDEYRSNLESLHSYQKQSMQNLYDTAKKVVEQDLNDKIDALDKQKDVIESSTSAEIKALEAAADAYEKTIDRQIDAIEKKIDAAESDAKAAKSSVESQKKAMQDNVKSQISAYEQAKNAAKDSADAEKKAAEERYKAIEKEIKGKLDLLEKERKQYQDLAAAKKKALQDEAKQENYEYELSQKQAKLNDLLREMASLQNDNSASAQRRKAEIQDEIEKIQHEIETFVRDHNIDIATEEIDAVLKEQEDELETRRDELNRQLDEEKERYDKEIEQIESVCEAQIKSYEAQIDALNNYMSAQEEMYDRKIQQIDDELEKEKKSFEAQKAHFEELKKKHNETVEAQKSDIESRKAKQLEALDAEIKAIQDNLKNQQIMHQLTMDEISKNNEDLYNDLIEYNRKYGSGIDSDIISMWASATEALKNYKKEASDLTSLMIMLLGFDTPSEPPKYAVGSHSLPKSGIIETDENGYEIKLNKTAGRHYEYMNAGSVILPNDATQKIMAFISNPSKYIRGVLGSSIISQPQSAIAGDVSAINTSISAPIEIVNNYQINGENPQDIANEIKKISQSCVDKAFDRLNSAMRKNGMGRRITQMA